MRSEASCFGFSLQFTSSRGYPQFEYFQFVYSKGLTVTGTFSPEVQHLLDLEKKAELDKEIMRRSGILISTCDKLINLEIPCIVVATCAYVESRALISLLISSSYALFK
jgi:hypothetical protein